MGSHQPNRGWLAKVSYCRVRRTRRRAVHGLVRQSRADELLKSFLFALEVGVDAVVKTASLIHHHPMTARTQAGDKPHRRSGRATVQALLDVACSSGGTTAKCGGARPKRGRRRLDMEGAWMECRVEAKCISTPPASGSRRALFGRNCSATLGRHVPFLLRVM